MFLTASEIRTKLAVGGLGTLHPWSQDEMKNRLNSETVANVVSCRVVSAHLLREDVKIKMYQTIRDLMFSQRRSVA